MSTFLHYEKDNVFFECGVILCAWVLGLFSMCLCSMTVIVCVCVCVCVSESQKQDRHIERERERERERRETARDVSFPTRYVSLTLHNGQCLHSPNTPHTAHFKEYSWAWLSSNTQSMQVTKASINSGPCSYQGTVPELFLSSINKVLMCILCPFRCP